MEHDELDCSWPMMLLMKLEQELVLLERLLFLLEVYSLNWKYVQHKMVNVNGMKMLHLPWHYSEKEWKNENDLRIELDLLEFFV